MSDLPPELEFVSEDDATIAELKAGLENKTLAFWRKDASGKRWFRRLSILALPVTSDADFVSRPIEQAGIDSSITTKGKMHVSVAKTAKAVVTLNSNEVARLAKRREVRRGLMRRKCIEGDIAKLRGTVAEIENRIDVLTAEHEAEVSKLRQEMEKLVDEMVDNGQTDELQAKRVGLQQRIIDATTSLEKIVTDARQEARAVKELVQPLEQQLVGLPIEFSLTHADVADPKLLDRSFVLAQSIKFLQARLDAAKESRGRSLRGLELANPKDQEFKTYSARLARWNSELSTVERELTEAVVERNRVHAEMIQE